MTWTSRIAVRAFQSEQSESIIDFAGPQIWEPRGQKTKKRTHLTLQLFIIDFGKSIFRSRPGKPNQKKAQNEKFMNFALFCEFWCFSLGKQARFTLNFCSGMALRKVHELTFLWFGLLGPLLKFLGSEQSEQSEPFFFGVRNGPARIDLPKSIFYFSGSHH